MDFFLPRHRGTYFNNLHLIFSRRQFSSKIPRNHTSFAEAAVSCHPKMHKLIFGEKEDVRWIIMETFGHGLVLTAEKSETTSLFCQPDQRFCHKAVAAVSKHGA